MMKHLILFTVILTSVLLSCDNSTENKSGIFNKSFKEKDSPEFCEYLDSITNIYSNFCYHVAFDAPDNWATDAGVSEHTIFRTHQFDSSLTFSINVIELNINKPDKLQTTDIWELYQKNEKLLDSPIIAVIEQHYNTKVTDFNTRKSFIKGNVAIKRSLRYNIYDMDMEYNMTNISFQVLRKNLMFTFTLATPTLFYQAKMDYFDNLFRNIYFLKDNETLEDLMNKVK